MLNLRQIPVVNLFIPLFVDSRRVIHRKVFKIYLKKKKCFYPLKPKTKYWKIAKITFFKHFSAKQYFMMNCSNNQRKSVAGNTGLSCKTHRSKLNL